MGSADMPEGLVKKETLVIGVVVALAVGFMGGVIYCSFRTPSSVAVSAGKSVSAPVAQRPAGLNADQATQIGALEVEVGRNVGNGGAWTQLGNLYFDTDQAPKAIVAYNKSLEINQRQPDVWTDLGVMYRNNRQFKEAVSAFDRAVALNPGLEQAYFNKGIVLVNDLGDKAGGIAAWQKAVAIDPDAKNPDGQLVRDMIAALK